MRVKGTYRKRERKSESVGTHRKERKGWKELNRERVDEGEGYHGARLHTQFHKKSDQSTYIYIARVLLSGPALSHSLSLSLTHSHMKPRQSKRAIELGWKSVSMVASGRFISWLGAPQHPFSLVDCQLNDHLGSGSRGKRRRFGVPFILPGQRKTYLRSCLTTRQRKVRR